MKDNRMKHALENIARSGVPEDINLMPHIAARLERKSFMTTLRTRPLVAVLLALLILIAMSGVAYAIGRTFGYIPGVGLVENETGMRVLETPVSVTRDGVTLTVTQVLVYPDHVQLVYEVSGIAPENNSATFSSEELSTMDQTAFCGPASSSRGGYLSDGDPLLRMPDGMTMDRVFDIEKYPENIFAMKPAYEVSLPSDVTELTMVLKCIPWARLGAVPEDWEIPLNLTHVPAGTVIGQPVMEVTPSGTSSVHATGMTVSLDKVVPQDERYSFYVSVVPDEKDESLDLLYPSSAYLIDATRQKTALLYNQPFPNSHDISEPWELQTMSKPGYGPYTMVLEKVFAYYNTTNSVFEFDAGAAPQIGQVWSINQTVPLDGGDVKVISVKMVEKDLSDWGMSANSQGFEFTFESVDGTTPMQLDIMDFDQEHMMSGMIVPVTENSEPAAHFTIALYYEKGVPSGKIQVTINKQTIMLTGNWELQWTSPDQTGITLLDSSNRILSKRDGSGVSATLEKVVKLDKGYLFYVDMTALQPEADLRVIKPGSVFVIDSTGKKIALELNGPQVYAATHQNIWEFTTETIAAGPLQLVIENATAYYNPWDIAVPPTPEMIAEQSFTFDAGAAPQLDQTWNLDQEFEVGGYRGKVVSVRAVPVDSQLLHFPELRPDQSIDRGYEFTIQSLDPAVRWNVGVFLARPQDSADAGFVDCIGYLDGEPSSTTTHTVTCRGLPDQKLQVTIYEVSVRLDGKWQINWNLPAQ